LYWGNPYACVPTDILGYYCCFDAFYTKHIYNCVKSNYHEDAIEIYNNNIKLGARLGSVGIVKDEQARQDYVEKANLMLAISAFHCIHFHFKFELERWDSEAKPYKLVADFDEVTQTLIEANIYNPNVNHMAKGILAKYSDERFEEGIDTNRIVQDLGHEVLDLVLEGFSSVGTNKLPANFGRKRTLLKNLGTKLNRYYKVEANDQLFLNSVAYYKLQQKVDKFDATLPQFGNYQELKRRMIEEESEHIYFDDQWFTFGRFKDHINGNYYKVSAPDSFKALFNKISTYKAISASLFTIPKFPDLDINKDNPTSTVNDIMSKWSEELPEDFKELFQRIIRSSHLQGLPLYKFFIIFRSYEKVYGKEEFNRLFEEIVNPTHLDINTHEGLFKILFYTRMFKRYIKLQSTYLASLLVRDDKSCSPMDENLVSKVQLPIAQKSEDTVTRMFPHFNVCTALSKRWTSGYHTIYSNEVKSVLSVPKGHLMSYFDISAAEVRTLAYKSGDPELVRCFEEGIDPYIRTAKMMLPDLDYNDPVVYGNTRSDFKVVLLGAMYLRSAKALGESLEKTTQYAQKMMDALWKTYPVAKKFIDDSANECARNNGRVSTILGDVIQCASYYRPDELMRRGINVKIQNFSAVCLASGFYNLVREADKAGLSIQPLIVVHDSSINYFPIRKLLEIEKFYQKHFTEYLYERFGVRWTFDTLIGANYYDLAEIKKVEGDLITLAGTNKSMINICKILDGEGIGWEIVESKSPVELEHLEMPDQFLKKYEAVFDYDFSFNKVTLKLTL